MELITLDHEKLAALPAALPMTAYDSELAELAAAKHPQAVYINRATWHVLTDHTRRAMLAATTEAIPCILLDIPENEEISAAIAYSGGINGNLAGKPESEADSLKLARTAWRLYHAGNEGRELLLTMGADPEYWLNLFEHLTEQAKQEPEPKHESPAPVIIEGYDIPQLPLEGQATREAILEGLGIEWLAWGSQARNKPLKATHFYTEDSRWTALEGKPDALKNAGVLFAIEPNYSTSNDMPQALVIADIYKKRRLSYDWIGQGIKVLVDVNVSRAFFREMLLGVPKGWKAFANRYNAQDPEHLLETYELITEQMGEGIVYLVYGTQGIAQICKERGWLFVDSDVSVGWKNGKATAQT